MKARTFLSIAAVGSLAAVAAAACSSSTPSNNNGGAGGGQQGSSSSSSSGSPGPSASSSGTPGSSSSSSSSGTPGSSSSSSSSGSPASSSSSSSGGDAGPPQGAGANDGNTKSPIKHVIVIIGENRSFDHVFATYKPRSSDSISNLLSKGIINADGTPGPNFATVAQQTVATPDGGVASGTTYTISPGNKVAYTTLPPVLAGGPKSPYETSVDQAQLDENGLEVQDYQLLTTGGTGLTSGATDTRVPNATALPAGPFQLTPGIAYDAYSASPVHRFYQMWQQMDCSVAAATTANPSGCLNDLFPWVETTIGAGSNGNPLPANFSNTTTREGSAAMGFYNVQQGDVPYFTALANTYTMSDNFHQSVSGGTGANHIMLGTGDAMWYSDGHGNAIAPPNSGSVPDGGVAAYEVENPNPLAGTANWYTQDGYSGGSYSNCSDTTQPGVSSVVSYLNGMHVNPNCQSGHYYLLNNYNPGYFGDGTVDTIDEFTIPPSSVPTIADTLMAHQISWRFYGDNWNAYLKDLEGYAPGNEYCNICNPFQYSTSVMANAANRTTYLKDTADLYADIANGFLPAFSIAKPSGLLDGHPASSKLDLFEGFTKKIIDAISANPTLFAETAIIVTFDEGGGYYDSGYIQPLDFFGDGTRIPAIVVSPHATGGHISHHYADHVSILKFVERNWSLPPVSSRSRDNFPNPTTNATNPYAPTNGPAISDMFDMFDFGP